MIAGNLTADYSPADPATTSRQPYWPRQLLWHFRRVDADMFGPVGPALA
jgi:hypothetical protein